MNHKKGQGTSKQAGEMMERTGKSVFHRNIILTYIQYNPRVTWAEIAADTGIQGVWKRISELRARGKIKACGKKGLCTLYRIGYDAKYVESKQINYYHAGQIR